MFVWRQKFVWREKHVDVSTVRHRTTGHRTALRRRSTVRCRTAIRHRTADRRRTVVRCQTAVRRFRYRTTVRRRTVDRYQTAQMGARRLFASINFVGEILCSTAAKSKVLSLTFVYSPTNGRTNLHVVKKSIRPEFATKNKGNTILKRYGIHCFFDVLWVAKLRWRLRFGQLIVLNFPESFAIVGNNVRNQSLSLKFREHVRDHRGVPAACT